MNGVAVQRARRASCRRMKRSSASKSLPRRVGSVQAAPRSASSGMVRGRLRALGADGVPWVTWAGAARPRAVSAAVDLAPDHVGREVLLAFVDGPSEAPVLVGVLRTSCETALPPTALDLTIDRERILLEARTEIVLRVGKAAITLGADGQVSIKGVNVASTALATNRIRGGNVQIN